VPQTQSPSPSPAPPRNPGTTPERPTSADVRKNGGEPRAGAARPQDAAAPAEAPSPAAPAGGPVVSRYRGPKDVGRAESLYRSALTKADPDYVIQLLFSALAANPDHEAAFSAIVHAGADLARSRRGALRLDPAGHGAAEHFIRSLAQYFTSPNVEEALSCAAEAQKCGLMPYTVALGEKVLRKLETGETPSRPATYAKVIDAFESAGALEAAARAARRAASVYPHDASFKEREKNLLASQYLKETDLSGTYRGTMRDPKKQEALHKPSDQAAKLDELISRYRASHRLEDFHELQRALRDVPAPRRESALSVLQEGLGRFGERETLWFVREIEIEREWAEVRVHQQMLDENPENEELRREHETLLRDVLKDHVDHLYEVVSSLPNTPERQRRELELAGKLFEAGRYEEAVKQAQTVKRRSEGRLDALVIMAKSFVQLGLTPEATECFQTIVAELDSNPHGPYERVLEAKYSYAEFLLREAEAKRDAVLAAQARKLCSDVMLEDIDYRDTRSLAARADAVAGKS